MTVLHPQQDRGRTDDLPQHVPSVRRRPRTHDRVAGHIGSPSSPALRLDELDH